MKKISPDDSLSHSADVSADNIEQLSALFPEAFTEGKIDFEVLKQLLGGAVDEREEKYGLNWHGKRKARQLALTPSTGTLRPCPDDSVDWDTTQNLMIEGDNLEVLKLLQKSYAGKVKLIYIDPPYNTGNDFIYPDNFQDNIKNYLELTGQTGPDGARLTSNTEASGRFHTDWLNMMYPRLKLARNLLRDDGLLMVSIDDNEAANMRQVCNDVFGEESFLLCFVWQRRQVADSRNQDNASRDHEYVLLYKKPGGQLAGIPIDREKYTNPDNDQRGPWFSDNLTGIANQQERPNLHYDLIDPETERVYPPLATRGWMCAPDTMARLVAEKRILWPRKLDGRPRLKKFLSDAKNFETGFSSWGDTVGNTSEGTRVIQELFGEKVFPFSKPVSLLTTLIQQGTPERDGIVMDFFAGSGTTAHGVMSQNAIDAGTRRYVLVQLPEPTTREDYGSIFDLTKERVRRSAKKVREENPGFAGDLGFRVFKLDASNIQTWDPDRQNLEQSLLDSIDHIKPDRSEDDVLYELLLKLGLDLCVPIEQRQIAGKTVHSIGAGVLLVCLAEDISRDDVEALAHGMIDWHKELAPSGETTIVFRDSSFQHKKKSDDVAKTNITEILKQHELKNIRSL